MKNILNGRAGRAFFNVCYSWGACLVILGAVLKIMNAPLDDTFLMIGLGVEVFIFFISAFEEPDRVYKWERAFPELDSKTNNAQRASSRIKKTEKLQKLEENMNKLNEIYLGKLNEMYEEQIKAAKDGKVIEELNKNTERMAENLSQLNEKYKKMLNSMN